jgi:hypothetical protein
LGMLRPMKRIGLPTRRRALTLVVVAVVMIAVLANVPPGARTVERPSSRLDEFAPIYHYTEVHSTHVAATPERVYAEVKAVTADDIALFQTFTWIRRFGQPGPESVMNAPAQQPLLDVALHSGFVLLADDPPREFVLGAIVMAPASVRATWRGTLTADLYRTLSAAGFVKATMNFRLVPEAGGTRISTETRIFGTDPHTIRSFTPYWRTIYPGSWILRLTWLRAIGRRAERGAA